MVNGFQAIKFVMLDFDANWKRTMLVTSYANIQYTSTAAPARLAVAFEGATGVMTTYRYELQAGEDVFVVDQVVHVPARCTAQDAGNTIRCGQD
jgi:hypothetical protein